MKLIKSITVFALAVVFLGLLSLVGLIYALFRSDRADYLLRCSTSISQNANCFAGALLNKIFIKNTYIERFGDEDETISGVLGENQKNLTWLGELVRSILDRADPDHTKNAIELDE